MFKRSVIVLAGSGEIQFTGSSLLDQVGLIDTSYISSTVDQERTTLTC
jgi:hypothetical protein